MGGSERKGTSTMGTMFIDGIHQLGTLEFWETLLDSFEGLGPVAPILLAMVESIFPPLPLIAIVALNVAAHGGLLGFVYSWVKRFFWKLASRSEKLKKAQQWVSHVDTATLFMLAVLPFTPTAFLHLAFGISDFDEKRYLLTLLVGKAVMVAMMALFGQSLVSSLRNPVYLILAIAIWAGMYWVSKKLCKKHDLN